MQLKVSTDYAIRIVLYTAITMKITTSKELSDKLGIPQSIVLKIGRNLLIMALSVLLPVCREVFYLKSNQRI